MAPFDFKSNKHFVASSDGATLQVYELTKPTLTHPSSIRKTHWREVANINTSLDDDDDMAEQTKNDGHGRIEGREAVTKLAQHLKLLSLMVSPGGHCFQDVNEMGEYVEFGAHYLRLNDLFSWPHHGVGLAATTGWGRSELRYHDPRHGQRSKRTVGGNMVSMEMYEELRRALKKNDEELRNLKEEKNDTTGLQVLLRREKEEELQKLRLEKDKEIENLRREKDKEVEKIINKDKVETLQKLNEKNEELRKLRKEKEDEAAKSKRMGDELQKLKKEKVVEASENLSKYSDNEVEEMKKEKDDELQKLRDQLRSSKAELTSVKQALGELLELI
ncbi:unnamed protein product [Linum tenue]|uniref:Uncharacterized protein n=1 Tax=Linum tenue TaxID=586396 RepID=A0AAV0JDE2_9ROSI|nr:unnamed protein product [Linum tenue]